MKKILSLILLSLLAWPASATPIGQQQSTDYYNNCLTQRDDRLSESGHKALCACSAAQMSESMTVEDIQTMGQDSPAGRMMLNKMLIHVYAPCMQYPVQDLVKADCLKDPKIDMMQLKTGKDLLCGCMAEKTGQWLATNGGSLMAELLEKNPNMADPITPVMESKSFEKESYNNLLACMNALTR